MKYITTLLLIFLFKPAFSQDLIEDYYDFGYAITEGREVDALAFAGRILPDVSNLSDRRKAIFYYKLASLHEGRNNTELAIDFYQKTLMLEPDYYVPHLALGYLYVGKANVIVGKINAEKSNAALRDTYNTEYKSYLKKAIPYFEKAMACDPNDQVLASIKNAYGSLKDPVSLSSLDSRLKDLEKKCIDVLMED